MHLFSKTVLLFCCCYCSSVPLSSQVQLNPYLFQWRPNSSLGISQGEDHADRSWGVGVDALLGSANLAPLVGFSYQERAYHIGESGGFELDELQLQLGLAWRIRQACTSFNLVPHVALSPGLIVGSSADSSLPAEVTSALEENHNWRLRTGLTLYLDFISLHYNWQLHLNNDIDKSTYRQLGIGLRF